MFNNFLGGLSSGGGSGGGGDALPTAVNGVRFDKFEATANFGNQLGPPQAEVITQTQVDAPTAGNIPRHPAPPGVGGGMNPPPPPPQQAGMGRGATAHRRFGRGFLKRSHLVPCTLVYPRIFKTDPNGTLHPRNVKYVP